MTRRQLRHYLLLVLIPALFFSMAGAESDVTTEDAAALFQDGKWEEAEAAYHFLSKKDPDDGQSWLQLGFARFQLKKHQEALAAFDRALQNGVKTPRLLATAAVCHEHLGRRAKAMEHLREAVEQGLPSGILTGNTFAFARDEAGYAALKQRADELSFPCRRDPLSRQFDFWIGDWDVQANGGLAGRNVISERHEGCLIVESYTTERGYSGQSFNFYDPTLEKWRQIWVDSGGNVIWYEGEFVEGEMRFEGEMHPRGGPKALSRMTFTPNDDGSVRQLIERSSDDGKTWTVGFDGHYVKKRKEVAGR